MDMTNPENRRYIGPYDELDDAEVDDAPAGYEGAEAQAWVAGFNFALEVARKLQEQLRQYVEEAAGADL